MNDVDSRTEKRQKIRKTVLSSLALFTTAVIIAVTQPVIQPSNVFAQTSSDAAEARAAAKARAKERAKASARESTRLFPRWNQRFDAEMIRYLESKFNVNATNLNGKTFGEIITTRGTHSIRDDRKDCVSCHGSPALVPGAGRLIAISEREFCNRLPAFARVNRPTTDLGHKPKSLKFLLEMWRTRSCGVAG